MNALQTTALRFALASSFLLRTLFTVFLDFEGDQLQVYHQGLDLYLHGKLSPYGAAVVYTGTAIPGALQSILAGMPLFLSHGLPWGTAAFVGFLNSLSTWMIFEIMAECFPKWNKLELAALILFAPWTLIFNGTWNPSYLPFFATLWLWGILLQVQQPKSFWAAFLIGLSMIGAFQLHLSCVLLPIGLAIALITRCIKIPQWQGLVTGTACGGLTLIPYFLDRTPKAMLSSNIQIHWDHVYQWPAFFLRFLSFPTAETTRFIGKYSGIGGTLTFLEGHPVWIPLAIFSVGMSLFFILLGVSFYANLKNWKLNHPRTIQEVFKILALILPILTGFLFGFSVTGPSAHTFWILVPLSFFPMLFVLQQHPRFYASLRPLWLIYCGIAPIFSLGTYWSVDRQSLYQTQKYALQMKHGTIQQSDIPTYYLAGVNEVLRSQESR